MSRKMNRLIIEKHEALIEAVNLLLEECINPDKQDKIKHLKNILNTSYNTDKKEEKVECGLCDKNVSLDNNYPSICQRPTVPQCSTCGNYVCRVCNYTKKGIYCLMCFKYSCNSCCKKSAYPGTFCFKCEENNKITCKIMSYIP